MASKRKRNISVDCSDYPKKFLCEWDLCQSAFKKSTVDALIRHVEEHLRVYYDTSQLSNPEQEATLSCLWVECNAQVVGTWSDFTRHVLFHVFHVKIKEIGRIVMENSDALFGVCSMGETSRNVIPDLPEKLVCGWIDCEEVYDNAEYFYRHVNQHADTYENGNKNEKKCPCAWDGCTSVMKSRYRLKEHLRSHTQEKIVACPKCGSLFSCRTKYLDHLRKQDHVEGLRYQCSHCSKRFATERLLRDHMRRHVNNYKCQLCDMTSPTPSGLKTHMAYRHSNERPYVCDVCNQSFKSMTDQRKHVVTHHEKSVLYSCSMEGCDYSTTVYSNLTVHMTKHETIKKRYSCHVCDENFLRGALLTKHLKKEHKYKWPRLARRGRKPRV